MADGLGTAGGVVSAVDHRLNQAGLIAPQTSTLAVRTGVMVAPGSTALVTGTSATGTMTVSIAAHHWVTTRGTADGIYLGTLEAATTVNIAAAPGSNSRIDVVYVKQNDANSTVTPDGSTAPLYGVATGTAAVSPTKPSIPVGAVELATVTVAVGATSTNGAGVTIANTARLVSARGARVWCRTQAERDALTAFLGLEVYRLDNGQVQLCTGISPTSWATTYDPAADPKPMFGEYSSTSTGVPSASSSNPGLLTKYNQQGFDAGVSSSGTLTLPAGLWLLQWLIVITGATVSGRNFIQADGGPAWVAPVGARQPFATIGDETGGGQLLIPLSVPTTLSLTYFATTTATFNATHGIRVVRLGGAPPA